MFYNPLSPSAFRFDDFKLPVKIKITSGGNIKKRSIASLSLIILVLFVTGAFISGCTTGGSTDFPVPSGSPSPSPSASPSPSPSPTPTAGTVSGTVTDEVTGSPVSGATVTVGSQSAQTAVDGTYSIENVPEGDQNVTATKDDYQDYNGTVTVQADAETAKDFQMKKNLPDVGEGVLLLGSDADSFDLTQIRWDNTSYTATQRTPADVIGAYSSGSELLQDYWCVWIGCRGDVVEADTITMLAQGGILDQFVQQGGILMIHGAYTEVTEPFIPGEHQLLIYRISVSVDDNPEVLDNDHEYIDGTPYSGLSLVSADF